MIVLLASVEVSDQYGTSESFVVGVFDDPMALERAKTAFDQRHPDRRVAFHEVAVELNTVAPITDGERALQHRHRYW